MAKFQKVDPKLNLPTAEEDVLEFWHKEKVFKRSLFARLGEKRFVFFEGPPTANGRPGIHHVLARAFKDVWPRFKTMQGYLVERKAGWDTHGLPVEIEVEKRLGLKDKNDIEKYGVAKFNQEAKDSVWKYLIEWENMTKRMGFWVDLDHPYVTYNQTYIESLWWVIKQVWDKGLLYQGHKVVPYCTRCGTSLSSHEVAQGYKEVEERSVYIKFKVKGKNNTYILAWTTTPWTLPGNVALAVGDDIDYVEAKAGGDTVLLAKDLLENVLGKNAKPLRTMKGKELVGLEYEPLFPGAIPDGTPNLDNAFKIYSADFVTTQDGTGVVHTAVMYGEDDYQLGVKIDLPRYHTVDKEGHFVDSVSAFKGKYVKDPEVEDGIVADLKKRGLLFDETDYKHDYPFCWRCDSPLLYYAMDSWFIRMQEVQDKLVSNNQTVNWVPGHLKDGRFGEWLKEIKDWAFSRERYWGTPLPIWRCTDCDHMTAVGDFSEFQKSNKPIAKVVFIRHGESEKNVKRLNSHTTDKWPLTAKGRRGVKSLAQSLDKADIIIASPVLRARETAEIVSQVMGGTEVVTDEALREVSFGDWNDKTDQELQGDTAYEEYRQIKEAGDLEKRFNFKLGNTGESRADVVDRVGKFIPKIAKQYAGKTVLLVGHGATKGAFYANLNGKQVDKYFVHERVGHDETHVSYLNPDGSLFDPHKPFVDEIELSCKKCEGKMLRVPEVCDVWFDSGCMPYAQWHYPFENKHRIDKGESFPADFISEAVDQTRGWFYTLLAVSTLLDKGAPYKNVISLGHILDKNGKKMSKRLGNIVEPWSMFDNYGADALRWYFYSVNQPGLPKNFDEDGVKQITRRLFLTLWNTLSFFTTYASLDDFSASASAPKPKSMLDKWMLGRLSQTISGVTQSLDSYDVMSATGQIERLIDDTSNWYVRRSRKRFWKSENSADKKQAYQTLYWTLKHIAILMAPFAPLVSEMVYKPLRLEQDPISVHLDNWPKSGKVDNDLIEDMQKVREAVELGHFLREEAKIKVRQPLSEMKLKIKSLPQELINLITDELNVKSIKLGAPENALDTKITPALAKEGIAREVVRAIQSLRKNSGLEVSDRIELTYDSKDKLLVEAIGEWGDYIQSETLAKSVSQSSGPKMEKVRINGKEISLGVKKA